MHKFLKGCITTIKRIKLKQCTFRTTSHNFPCLLISAISGKAEGNRSFCWKIKFSLFISRRFLVGGVLSVNSPSVSLCTSYRRFQSILAIWFLGFIQIECGFLITNIVYEKNSKRKIKQNPYCCVVLICFDIQCQNVKCHYNERFVRLEETRVDR